MEDDFVNAKTVEECTEMAAIDCNDEYDQAGGWIVCFDEIFSDVKQVKVFNEPVRLKKFDLANDVVLVAVCEKNKKKAKVRVDSIELIDPTKAQELWLDAWKNWSKSN